jgi:hypothetical protein
VLSQHRPQFGQSCSTLLSGEFVFTLVRVPTLRVIFLCESVTCVSKVEWVFAANQPLICRPQCHTVQSRAGANVVEKPDGGDSSNGVVPIDLVISEEQ